MSRLRAVSEVVLLARRLFVSSSSNPRVRALRRLARTPSAELCLAEGSRAVEAALAAGAAIRELYVAPELLRGDDDRRLVDRVEARAARVVELEPSVFAALTPHVRPDGLLATVARPATGLATLDPPSGALLAVAVGIERPGNLGTILRTAAAAAVDGVIVADPCTDPYHPEVVRGSVGTVFHVKPVAASSADALDWLVAHRFRIVATTPAGDVDYDCGDYRGNVAIAVGSERHGLPRGWLASADRRVAIPMPGVADSLNVAVAWGVVLFQAVGARARPPDA